MGWSPNHKPIRAKYSPRMTAAEQRHRARVLVQPCFGCGWPGVQAHHTLLKIDGKRWRRDHYWLLPVCQPCHTEIHDTLGSEVAWLSEHGKTEAQAIEYMRGLHA